MRNINFLKTNRQTDLTDVWYSETNSHLVSNNRFRFQSNVVNKDHLWESFYNFFEQIFEKYGE